MNKYITEFIGTFFLVLTIGCTVIPGAPGTAPAASSSTTTPIALRLMERSYFRASSNRGLRRPAVD